MLYVASNGTLRDHAATSPTYLMCMLSTCNSVGVDYVFFFPSRRIDISTLTNGGRVKPVRGEIPNKMASVLLHNIFGLMSQLNALSTARVTYLLYVGLIIKHDCEKT